MDWYSWLTLLVMAAVVWCFFLFIYWAWYKFTGWRLKRRYEPKNDTGGRKEIPREIKIGGVGESEFGITG